MSQPSPPRVVLVTGLSGAGKSSALKILEDVGYEAVDNLPLTLVGSLIRPGDDAYRALAIGVDARTRDFSVDSLVAPLDSLAASGAIDVRILFLDCEDEVLRRRFSETRRRHPLAGDRPLIDSIQLERRMMAPLRQRADLVIDTSQLSVADTRRLVEGHLALDDSVGLRVSLTSFAYRGGLPREADLVFDVRFLANPHYVDDLRPLTGLDAAVAAHVEADPDFGSFFDHLTGLIAPLLPRYASEGKHYLTIAIGCTGGRHRSVMVAERLAHWLDNAGHAVRIRHREIDSVTAGDPSGPATKS